MDDVFDDEDEVSLEPDCDPSTPYWGSYLMFHRRLSDDEMQWHFGDRDGRWSRQTKATLQRSGANGLDLNRDAAKARAIWEAQRGGFEMRLRLLDMLILEIGAGRLAHDREGWPGIVPMQEQLGR